MSGDDSLILAIDQGTSSTKVLAIDAEGRIVARATARLDVRHPAPGRAEQDALDIWHSVRRAAADCLEACPGRDILATGLSAQRESVLLWDRETGEPLDAVVGWQDARGLELCEDLKRNGLGEEIRAASGLPVDTMWSASKARWLLDVHDKDRARSERGELCLGTVDSWLLYKLGAGHVIEVGSASRTQLLNIAEARWDERLLEIFGVPRAALPEVRSSIGTFCSLGAIDPALSDVPVTAVLGDSHASLFAHGVRAPGQVKATYGTGSSVMGISDRNSAGSPGICKSIAWDLGQASETPLEPPGQAARPGAPTYAAEGNIRSSGATLSWLASLLGTTPDELSSRAAESSDGVHIVPAFTGLGAPWWDDAAQGVISGLNFGTGAEELACAGLESIAFQVEDVIAEIQEEAGQVRELLADGGASKNPRLMQLQADLSQRRVVRAIDTDLSALGAGYAAGLGVRLWSDQELTSKARAHEVHEPAIEADAQHRRRVAWKNAVSRARATDASMTTGA